MSKLTEHGWHCTYIMGWVLNLFNSLLRVSLQWTGESYKSGKLQVHFHLLTSEIPYLKHRRNCHGGQLTEISHRFKRKTLLRFVWGAFVNDQWEKSVWSHGEWSSIEDQHNSKSEKSWNNYRTLARLLEWLAVKFSAWKQNILRWELNEYLVPIEGWRSMEPHDFVQRHFTNIR